MVANPAAAAAQPGRFIALDSLRGLAALGIAHGKGGLQAAIDWLGAALRS